MARCLTCNVTATGLGWSAHLGSHRRRKQRVEIELASGRYVEDFRDPPAPAESAPPR